MPILSGLNKENIIKGPRRAKPAPDFSKLHKKWDAKLQKGKAVTKKPLTEVQPFPLTSTQLSTSSINEFQCDPLAKESILNCDGIKESNVKAYRSTIGVVQRSSLKSQIPRSSFSVSQRNSHYTKARIDSTKLISPSLVTKNNGAVSKPNIISSNVPKVKSVETLQGFTVDFKPDENALESIMNCEGISFPITPAKYSSQFGPEKKKKIKGRVVPFTKTIPNSRFSFNARATTQNEVVPKNKRFSVFQRDSFSTKPDLMTWLKSLQEKPVRNSFMTKSSSADVLGLTKATATTHGVPHQRHSLYTNHKLPSLDEQPGRSSFYKEGKTVSNLTKENSFKAESFTFKKTLVGYQGDNNESEFQNAGEIQTDNFTSPLYATPSKNNLSVGSSIKSILKKKTPMKSITEVKKVEKTPTKLGVKVKKGEKTPTKPGMKLKKGEYTTPMKPNIEIKKVEDLPLSDRTPIRLSAYARNQRLLGLPLPRENRYERLGEHIMEPPKEYENHVISSPTTIKRVRWAENLRNSIEHSDLVLSCIDRHSPIHQITTSPVSCASPRVTTHQIKYVMPAEQPLENSSSKISKVQTQFSNNSAGENSTLTNNGSWANILSRELMQDVATDNSHSSRRCLQKNFDSRVSHGGDGNVVNSYSNTVEKVLSDARYASTQVTIEEHPKKDIIVPTKEGDQEGYEDILNKLYRKTPVQQSRPTPALDEKLVKNLMSFSMDCDDYWTSIVEESDSLVVPMQSTLISTTPLVKENETPPLSAQISLNSTLNAIPEAPSKKAKAMARTPYKQALLDYLEKTLAASKHKNNETLDCTVTTDAIILDNLVAGEKTDTVISNAVTGKNALLQLSVENQTHTDIHTEHTVNCSETIHRDLMQNHPNENHSQNHLIAPNSMREDSKQDQNKIADEKCSLKLATLFTSLPTPAVHSGMTTSVVNIISPSIKSFPSQPITSKGINASILSPKESTNMLPKEYSSKQLFSAVSNNSTTTSLQHIGKESSEKPFILKAATFIAHRGSNNEPQPHANQDEKNIISSNTMLPITAVTTSHRDHHLLPTNQMSDFLKPLFDTLPSSASSHMFSHKSLIPSAATPGITSAATAASSFLKPSKLEQSSTLIAPDITNSKLLWQPTNPSLFSSNVLKPSGLNSNSSKFRCPNILKPSSLNPNLHQSTVNVINLSSTGTQKPVDESFMLGEDDSDVCLVFNKNIKQKNGLKIENHSGVHPDQKNSLHSTCVQQVLKTNEPNNDDDLQRNASSFTVYQPPASRLPSGRIEKSAFERVPPTCNVFPRIQSSINSNNASMEIQALGRLHNWLLTQQNSRNSALDAEISLYTKFGEISERFVKKVQKKRDGSTCTLKKLLNHGDETHFIPIETNL